MKNCLLIFPNNLFNKKYLPKVNDVYLIEESLFFGDNKRVKNFNKLKLVLHRASMKYYCDYLKENNYNVKYINFDKKNKYEFLNKYDEINFFELSDHLLNSKLTKKIKNNIIVHDTPLFLLNLDDLNEYKKTKAKSKTFFHKHFYDWQLKKLDIPFISKSYDTDNRKSIPSKLEIPKLPKNDNKYDSNYINEAKKYIQKNFKNNYGNIDNFIFPVTHKTSKKWLKDFIKNRLYNFGNYQDAIQSESSFLFHSLLSSIINIGLLTPKEVIDETIKFYSDNKKKIKINNFEGFIRQVIGWREYQRMLYILDYENQIKSNYFGNSRSLNEKWYHGETGILPIDDTIKKAFNYGYLNHIERLMVMLNFMVLNKIKPFDVYRWFMEFACDSYDWVMVGNVYGMGYYSTNTMRKPYLSTSNYIVKMSNYKKDGKWDIIWDSLFYNFLSSNKPKLKGGAAFYLRNLRYLENKKPNEKKEFLSRGKYI